VSATDVFIKESNTMQHELTELKSKGKVTGRRSILLPLPDESRERSTTLLKIIALLVFAAAGFVYFTASGLSQSDREQDRKIGFDRQISENAQQMMKQGKQIFRYDTFGDEAYWTDKLNRFKGRLAQGWPPNPGKCSFEI
jgi:hypothetical protein